MALGDKDSTDAIEEDGLRDVESPRPRKTVRVVKIEGGVQRDR